MTQRTITKLLFKGFCLVLCSKLLLISLLLLNQKPFRLLETALCTKLLVRNLDEINFIIEIPSNCNLTALFLYNHLTENCREA